jgi:AP endonuclease-2
VVYTNSRKVVPLKAEEGLSGHLQPKPPLSTDEQISTSYLWTLDIDFVPDSQGNKPTDLISLDCKGCALVLDLGLFVLINLQCPSDKRLAFKMNYHLMLQARVEKLLEERREVIVLGDINICATPLDHNEGHLPSCLSGFYEQSDRAWFRKWLEPEGPMTDVVRTFWPERKGMFTCESPH